MKNLFLIFQHLFVLPNIIGIFSTRVGERNIIILIYLHIILHYHIITILIYFDSIFLGYVIPIKYKFFVSSYISSTIIYAMRYSKANLLFLFFPFLFLKSWYEIPLATVIGRCVMIAGRDCTSWFNCRLYRRLMGC